LSIQEERAWINRRIPPTVLFKKFINKKFITNNWALTYYILGEVDIEVDIPKLNEDFEIFMRKFYDGVEEDN
jgi:hypothetical protein